MMWKLFFCIIFNKLIRLEILEKFGDYYITSMIVEKKNYGAEKITVIFEDRNSATGTYTFGAEQ